MRSRLGLVSGLVAGGLLGAVIGLGVSVETSRPPMVIAAALLGALVLGALGQIAQWVRAAAGSTRRLEYAHARAVDAQGQHRRRLDEVHNRLGRTDRDLTKRIDTVTEQVTRLSEHVSHQPAEIGRQTRQIVDDQVALLQAHSQLQRLVSMNQVMPRPGTWAASEDLLLYLVGHVLREQPALIVDLGSGQSSVWMAAALRQSGSNGRVVAIDHDLNYAEQTRELAAAHGLSRWLDVRVAPLQETQIEGQTYTWYDRSLMTDLHNIGLLSVDGPPGQGGKNARWPALPLLQAQMATDGVVVMDDMVRNDEQAIVADWLTRFPQWQVTNLHFEKGAAALRRVDSGRAS